MLTFEEMGIGADILRGIKAMGFETPMPIQEKVIPMLLAKQGDLIGLAQTGTGKTAAFGLPIIQLTNAEEKQPQALVLAPTRELCLQITGDLQKYAKYLPGLQIVAVYGGADIDRQVSALRKGAQIIVATPGRMNDLLNKRKTIDLSAIKTVVLDEADEMLDMGFKEELDAILEQTPASKNTLLFSATMPAEVLNISKNYMHEPREITIGRRNAGAEQVEHIYYMVHAKDRYLALKRIVDSHPEIYGIIFCRTRQETKEVADHLIQDGYNADALHGDLSQAQRETIMHKFRIKHLQMLVATDVAARGLDVKDITHIINYNLPDEDDLYTHRSGRTGRAGQTGISIAIVNLKEKYRIRHIEAKLQKKFTQKPVPGGKEICEKQLLKLVDKMQTIEVNHAEIDPFLPAVYAKLEWLSREDLIKHFVSLEFNRFLDYYKDAKDLNPPPPEPDARKKGKKAETFGPRGDRPRSDQPRGARRGTETGFTRFFINLGAKDQLTPRELIGFINRCTQNRKLEIGRIDLMDSFSFFEVPHKHTFTILGAFQGVKYNDRAVSVEIAQGNDRPQAKPAQRNERYAAPDRPRARKYMQSQR